MFELNQFYRLSLEARRKEVEVGLDGKQYPHLSAQVGDAMVENFIDYYQLPLGLATNLRVDGLIYQVPMATEEPSVIAAASNGAKIAGNIKTWQDEREIVGQIVLENVTDTQEALQILEGAAHQLLDEAQKYADKMVKRGGGPKRIWFKAWESYITLYIGMDPCQAMGANAMNHLLESLSPSVLALVGDGQALLRILSNYQPDRLTYAQVAIPFNRLSRDEALGEEIANKICKASDYAHLDPYRAVTHNKGILNGIDAVTIATGNDWRANNAAIHAFAACQGQYLPLTRWWIEDQKLFGQIALPLAIATVGGTIKVHPQASWSHTLLGQPSAEVLSRIVAGLGLVQNLAALRALVTDGIQKGHMALHARQLALQVGANKEEQGRLIQALIKSPKMSESVAQALLEEIRKS